MASVVDEIGEWLPTGGGYSGIGPSLRSFVGNVFDVTASRKLTKIAMHVTFPETVPLTWEVYENVGGVYRSIASTMTSQPAVNGFAVSGAFNVILQAGHVYAIGFVYSPPTSDVHTMNGFCDDRTTTFATPATGYILVEAPTGADEFTPPYPPAACVFRQQLTLGAL